MTDKNKWKSCKVCVPDVSKVYLVTRVSKGSKAVRWLDVACWHSSNHWTKCDSLDGFIYLDDVIAWQELPPIYKR